MSAAEPFAQLRRECQVYARYLAGQPATDYVVERYLDCHSKSDRLAPATRTGFDHYLLRISVRGPYWTRLADSYAAVFSRDAILRRKLVLTLALLECTPPSFQYFDSSSAREPVGATLRVVAAGVSFVFNLAFALIVISPARLFLAVSRREIGAGK